MYEYLNDGIGLTSDVNAAIDCAVDVVAGDQTVRGEAHVDTRRLTLTDVILQ